MQYNTHRHKALIRCNRIFGTNPHQPHNHRGLKDFFRTLFEVYAEIEGGSKSKKKVQPNTKAASVCLSSSSYIKASCLYIIEKRPVESHKSKQLHHNYASCMGMRNTQCAFSCCSVLFVDFRRLLILDMHSGEKKRKMPPQSESVSIRHVC